MEAMIIEATEFSPGVVLDSKAHKFEISGDSRPENTGKLYEPIIKWIEQYQSVLYWQKNTFGKQTKMIFEFKF